MRHAQSEEFIDHMMTTWTCQDILKDYVITEDQLRSALAWAKEGCANNIEGYKRSGERLAFIVRTLYLPRK